MKAVVYTKYGPPEVLELRAYPKSPDALNVIHAHAKCNNAR